MLPRRVRAGLSLAAGCLIMTSIGAGYAISAWNAQLKAYLQMDQSQIAFTIVVGTILLPLLYALLSMLTAAKSSPLALALALGCIGLSSQFAGIVSLGANEGLYGERHRGLVLGLLLSCFSAGGAVFSLLYKTFFNDHVAAYFSFMSAETLLVCGLGVLLLLPHDDEVAKHEYAAIDADVNVTGWALTKDVRFWYLFFAVLIGVGSGLFVMANLAFLLESAGGAPDAVAPYVSLFSLCNLVGRLVVGHLSDTYLATWTRASFLGLGLAMTMLGQVLFVLAPLGWFFVPVAVGGIAEGFLFPTYTVLTRELFGAKYFGENFGAMTLANAIGFPLLLGPLSSRLYRIASALDPTSGAEVCVGRHCFFWLFAIAFGLNGLGLYCAYKLHLATRTS
ncbi:hypothetical protein SPRG_16411 [Saprolegnia parasitica CBS 223.65]|uniref:Major facilitator superfamily (MFS) profile domain-containing protein n=1 Tax=Saprolegnia parasitica (strain CBS 223.65) TaxID=695850 RepID=A0A067BIT2_SAPPC|nr:hypothetical protein SPRG_16411 [Saprolegnia parasitica CBS 223.65]KDO18083.1 hypothetical protein SPRG_16411 [Saprolegnia parasitica CBS 223.65]|eukprot:XP_012211209.1 hypothetical protein SPRG_16411 [Saprolegnia parasitica CBS 223.65]